MDKGGQVHMPVRSSVFHYELEQIYPFIDGRGRNGCPWGTLLLSEWTHVFEWLPVESMIHANPRA